MKLSRLFSPAPKKTPQPQVYGFDEAFYLLHYPDVSGTEMSPVVHYLSTGWKEGRDPCAGFSTLAYLAANPDVKSAGVNPLIHFLMHGIGEGRVGWRKDPNQLPANPRPLREDTAYPPASGNAFVA